MIILPNNVAVIKGDTHHALWCATEGLVHDRFTAAEIRSRMFEVKVAIDAGANIGTLTRVMIDSGATVHAIECNPAAIECLRYNCPEAIIHPFALSDVEEELQFIPNRENAGASFTWKEERIGWLTNNPVKAVPLDFLNLEPGFIKFDIEGAEVAALKGAWQTIMKCRPCMMIEVNRGALERFGENEESLISLLRAMKYSTAIIQPNCKAGDPQYDILAIPALL